MQNQICILCNKEIKERDRLKLVYETRRKYRTYWKGQDILLYFHIGCTRKINLKINNLLQLLIVINKLGMKKV